jgi:hypothetical protein
MSLAEAPVTAREARDMKRNIRRSLTGIVLSAVLTAGAMGASVASAAEPGRAQPGPRPVIFSDGFETGDNSSVKTAAQVTVPDGGTVVLGGYRSR